MTNNEISDLNKLIEFDNQHIWHPYTSMSKPVPAYLVDRCEGVYIHLATGEKLIDGMSSWWSTIHGYNNAELNKAATDQLQKMAHVMFGGLTHRPAIKLAQLLIEMTPKGLDHVFFADSGSVAVEVALKMAIQYQYSQKRAKKNQIITIKNGYHGDTWHAMSVCDPINGMHSLFEGRLTPQIFVDQPKCQFHEEWNPADLDELTTIIEKDHHKIGAMILEPIVQGAGGMRFYHPEYLRGVRELCSRFDIVLIADEIATGFGRSGKMFACEWADIVPDIMCLGKALTGGYMTMAAVMASSKIAHGIEGAFMHGPTFMANPLAAAVACRSLELLQENPPLERIKQIEVTLEKELRQLENYSQVAQVRILGAIGVVEMKEDVRMAEIQAKFINKGIWIRPFGKLIYIMPQYIISDHELEHLCRAMVDVITDQN